MTTKNQRDTHGESERKRERGKKKRGAIARSDPCGYAIELCIIYTSEASPTATNLSRCNAHMKRMKAASVKCIY